MTTQTQDLSVRRHDRYLCDLPALVVVGGASASAVRVSLSAAGSNGSVTARVSDFSQGGLGINSPIYLPLTCQLQVRVTPTDSAVKPFELKARIQRVAMMDRKPTYYLGAAFEGLAERERAVVEAMMAWLKASGAKLLTEKSRA